MKQTKAEERLGRAKEIFANPPQSVAAQAEAAMLLKTNLRLTRQEIATVLGMSYRQTMTRLHKYKYLVATGQIPSGELGEVYTVLPQVELLDDEVQRIQRSVDNKQAKAIISGALFEDRVAEAVAIHAVQVESNAKDIERMNREARKARPKAKGDEEVAILTQSDSHFGLVNPHYNTAIARQANDTLINKALRLTELHRTQCPVKTIHYNAIGDNIQGSYANFSNQRWTTDLCAVDQVDLMTEIMVGNIERLLIDFDNVIFNGMPGNHGNTLNKKTTTEPDHANFETMAHRAIRWAFRGNKRVSFNLTTEWYNIVEMGGRKVLLTHGHSIPGAGSFDGIQNTFRKLQDILPYFDDVFIGHFHRLARIPLPRVFASTRERTIRMNGTLVRGDAHIEQFGSAHTNEQWFVFAGGGRMTAEYPIPVHS